MTELSIGLACLAMLAAGIAIWFALEAMKQVKEAQAYLAELNRLQSPGFSPKPKKTTKPRVKTRKGTRKTW